MDCEMVECVGPDMVATSQLARVTLLEAIDVTADCVQFATLMDEFVKPSQPVFDFRTHISGVTAIDLEGAHNHHLQFLHGIQSMHA